MALPTFARKAANVAKAARSTRPQRAKPPLEAVIQNDIRLALGLEPGLILWRNNVGHVTYWKQDGSKVEFDYGLEEGSADLIGCLNGRFIALEVKRPGEHQRPAQVEWEGRVKFNHGFYAVVRSVEEARAAIARARTGACE